MEVGWAIASIAILADGKLLAAGITKKSDKFFRTKIARGREHHRRRIDPGFMFDKAFRFPRILSCFLHVFFKTRLGHRETV
jgi:hypothetical protein